MKASTAIAAASLALFSTIAAAQLPPGITMDMINTTLPEEGAPKAIPGQYKVASGAAFGAAGLKVFHPEDLSRFPKKDTLPVFVWGNGGCAIDNPRYAGFLTTIASHGFLVVTTTASAATAPAPAAGATAGPPARARQATAADLKAGIDWAEKENNRDGSPLKGKIETKKVAVMGTSCSGRLSIELGADPRVSTIGVFNAGLDEGKYEPLARLHGPVMFINGGKEDFMMGPSKATYDKVEKLPAFYGARHGAGHTATSYHVGGGEFANVATNWALWQLKKDKQAAKMFTGKKCALCVNENWDAEGKRLK
jgi:dienelactone hydrolase